MTHCRRRLTASSWRTVARSHRRIASSCASLAMLALPVGCSSGGNPSAATRPSTPASASTPASQQAASPNPSPSTLPAGVIASIRLDTGAGPFAAVGGHGSVWIAAHRGQYLYRVNPATNRIQKSISIVGGQCLPPVAGAGRVWAASCSPDVGVVDPQSNQVVGSAPGLGVFAVVNGVPWSYTIGGIQSLDPRSYKVTRTFHVDANPRQVSHPDVEATYGDGAFWAIVVADEDQTFGGSVVKIDAETGKVDRTYTPPDPGGYADIKFLDHAVWLKGDDSGRLVKLDTTTGRSRVYRLPGFEPLNSFYPMTMGVGIALVDPTLQRPSVTIRPGHRQGHCALPRRPARKRRIRLRVRWLTVGGELRC